MKIVVVGLGKLGLCTSACFAAKKHVITGIDNNKEHIKKLNDLYYKDLAQVPILEPNLKKLLYGMPINNEILGSGRALTYLEFFHDKDKMAGQRIGNCDIICIIVPTPSKDDGAFSNDYILEVLKNIAPHMPQDKCITINIISTVMPGSCDEVFIPFLESETGMKCGTDFGFTYNPEFIALGTIIENFLNPDMVLIGASDNTSAQMVRYLYENTVTNRPHYATMSLLNAELTKLSLNCYLTTKISFANELGAICEKIKGADVDKITNAIGHDSRIGSKCLKSGVGFSGPCFGRDTKAFIKMCDDINLYNGNNYPNIISATEVVNNTLLNRIMDMLSINKKICLGILGFSYKPQSHITEESQALKFIDYINRDYNYELIHKIFIHDPYAYLPNEYDYVCQKKNASALIETCQVIIIMVDHPEYHNLDWNLFKGKTVIDCWRIVPKEYRNIMNYKALGLGL